jgi:hypothetical protein
MIEPNEVSEGVRSMHSLISLGVFEAVHKGFEQAFMLALSRSEPWAIAFSHCAIRDLDKCIRYDIANNRMWYDLDLFEFSAPIPKQFMQGGAEASSSGS